MKYIPGKHYKEFCADLKAMYGAISLKSAEANFDKLRESWGDKYPGAVGIGEQNFICVAQLFDYSIEIRKQIYTTNIMESLNSALRKVTDQKGAFKVVIPAGDVAHGEMVEAGPQLCDNSRATRYCLSRVGGLG